MQPVGAPSRDDLFSVNRQGRPCMRLSIVLDRFQHRYRLHGVGRKNGLHRIFSLALPPASVRLASRGVIFGGIITSYPCVPLWPSRSLRQLVSSARFFSQLVIVFASS